MEHPVRDIRGVIRSLAQGTPEEQQDTVNRYYLPSASFVHPFCRIPSFEGKQVPFVGEVNSRMLVLAIYRWYKILSPKIDLQIESTVFDQRASLLYVTIHQTFSIWFLPFHRSPVRLVTVLHLTQDQSTNSHSIKNGNGNTHLLSHESTTTGSLPLGEADTEPSFAEVASPETNTATAAEKASKAHTQALTTNHTRPDNDSGASFSSSSSTAAPSTSIPTRRYRIKKQEDLYQVNEFLKFILMGPGSMLYGWFQLFSSAVCVAGVLILGPLLAMVGFGRRVPAATATLVPAAPASLMVMMNGDGDGNEREKKA